MPGSNPPFMARRAARSGATTAARQGAEPRVGGRDRARVERAPGFGAPQEPEHQRDVAARLVLQGEAGRGHAGPGVEAQREAPQRIVAHAAVLPRPSHPLEVAARFRRHQGACEVHQRHRRP